MTSRLKRAWERTRSVPGLGRDVSVIISLVLVGVLSASVILAKQRVHWPWQHEFVFEADFRSTPGISPSNGQEVRIAGVTVGRISKADVTSNGEARLTFGIDPKYAIYRDTRLVLRPKTPLNDMYVEMSQGTKQAGRVTENEVIPVSQTSEPVEIDEVLSHLDDTTRNALSSLLDESDAALASAPTALPNDLDEAQTTLTTFKPVINSLEQRRQKIAELVTDLNEIASATGDNDKRLEKLTNSMATTLTTLAAHDKDVRAALNALPGVTQQLRKSTASVRSLSTQLDPTLKDVQSASKDLPPALSRVATLSGSLKTTMQKARPTVHELRPVVADLRPFVADLKPILQDVAPISSRLDSATKTAVSRLPDLQAFIYNTTSVVSLQDANGGILRGQIQVNTSTLPIPMGGDN